MANHIRSVLYIGVTNDLYARYCQHYQGVNDGFTKRYKCHYLIYFEEFLNVEEAIAREKVLKGWKRERKLELIRAKNPLLYDYAEDFGWK